MELVNFSDFNSWNCWNNKIHQLLIYSRETELKSNQQIK